MKMYFFVILTLIFYFQTYSVYGIEKENQTNNKQLVEFLQNYWQWGVIHLKIVQIIIQNAALT